MQKLSSPLINRFFSIMVISFLAACQQESSREFTSWRVYRGDEGSNAYSQLDQINTKNVKQLKVVWIYRTGDKSEYNNLECNPIIINNILYGISPRLKTFAVNAKTGKEIWVFNPFEKNSNNSGVGRGLMYWKSGNEERIYMFAGSKLIALDAKTGQQIKNFGDSGYVDLTKGLRSNDGIEHVEDVGNTSPGVIYKDLIISGSGVSENYGSSPGHIRAYDVRTGKMKWIFHTIPHPGEFGHDTWPKDAYKTVGGCNAWSGLSLDSKRGIVFAATGAPAFDFHGGERIGQNLFGNSVLALDATTGKLIWHFQVSHHDLWDYDLPSPPNLITIKKDDKTVDAVAQITKQGLIFLFERETGTPIFPIEEKPVVISTMEGEQSWSTQPFPVKPLPLCRQTFDESMITDISAQAHDYVLNLVKNYTWGKIYLPPSMKGIVQLPGFRGGGEWSGGCVDRETGIMYIGINDIANIVHLVERKDESPEELAAMPLTKAGKILFERNCAACHGNDLKGNRSFPPLFNIENRYKPEDLKGILQKPRGMMPSFNALPEQDKDAITDFLFKLKNKNVYQAKSKNTNPEVVNEKAMKRYALKGYMQLKDQNGYFGTKPPWGTLNAVNLNTGELVWKIPLGEYPELVAKGIHNTGSQLFGGGIVTAGGLIFIGASQDEKFRAIKKTTGKILWEYQLPFGGYATPATYEIDGKQYIVIAAGGGGRQLTKAGDYYIAFALP
ncbi:MAG: pyrroloquinoline quinone-dependent dehydrogenase [Ginsengibacter sp.]